MPQARGPGRQKVTKDGRFARIAGLGVLARRDAGYERVERGGKNMGDSDPVAAATDAIVRQFEASGIPYALGGALALAYWAEPRATRDVDLNVFVAERLADTVVGALQAAGCTVDAAAACARVRERGDLMARFDSIRVDLRHWLREILGPADSRIERLEQMPDR